MESMVMEKLFGGIYKGKKVLITGHTGFKGSWLAFWLQSLGADLYGIALPPPTKPNHYDLLDLKINSFIQDINELSKLREIFTSIKPDIIFHLAAQPIVRLSYKEPVNTYMTNIMGTVNVLEAARYIPNLRALVVITSDKCYENKEWIWGYRENDPMGGEDPYSSSKGCAELVINAYKKSFYNSSENALIASARAGNVVGGGDWAQDRIITDLVTTANIGKTVYLRYPNATRPWQYVLEPLSGYLTLGWQLLLNNREYEGSWNFGPHADNNISVLELVKESQKCWKKIKIDFDKNENPHEAGFLMLDSSKAVRFLKWGPVWKIKKTVGYTIDWYKEYYENGKIVSNVILESYIDDAQQLNISWSKT